MQSYPCPKNHESSEPDFCSVCGFRMRAPVAARSSELCPDCGAAREPSSGIFCEICGYDFNTDMHGAPKSATSAPPPAPATSAVPAHSWGVLIEIDPSLKALESPDPPEHFEPITIQLEKESNLIGRTSEKRGVFPEISLDLDEAVSHRHAFLNRTPEGGLILRDIGSSNGTALNGANLIPLTDTPVKEGDQLTLGHWTRITIK